LNSTDMARLAAGAALDIKALDPLILDLRGISSVAEFFVILTGTSNRHVVAVAENVMDVFKAVGIKALGDEGTREGKWVLLDYGEIVVHVFLEPVREYYDIERLWIDAPRLDLSSSGDSPGDAPGDTSGDTGNS
jgi:ribosome-associated protein